MAKIFGKKGSIILAIIGIIFLCIGLTAISGVASEKTFTDAVLYLLIVAVFIVIGLAFFIPLARYILKNSTSLVRNLSAGVFGCFIIGGLAMSIATTTNNIAHPTPTPSPTFTSTLTLTPSQTSTITYTSTNTSTLTLTSTLTPSSTSTINLTPSVTTTLTPSPTLTIRPTDTRMPTLTSAPYAPPANTLVPYVPDQPTDGDQVCCKTCGSDSKACGDSCIVLSKTCHQPPGCACQ